MTPNELYAMEPEEVTYSLDYLSGVYFNHVDIDEMDMLATFNVKQDRVEIRMLKNFCFDGRRIWRLATVWFDKQPVMVIQNAGREGDDHQERFITDVEQFSKMVGFIRSLVPPEQIDVYDPNQQIDGLTSFYGNSLDGPFEYYR